MDLLPEEEKDDIEELKTFSEDNGFNGYFRTSAKTGENINESMEFIIIEINRKLEDIKAKKINSKRNRLTIDHNRNNEKENRKKKNDNSGCC